MVAICLVVALAFAAVVLSLAARLDRVRGRVDRLERRVAALELEQETTLVIEPEAESSVPAPPRPPSQLLN